MRNLSEVQPVLRGYTAKDAALRRYDIEFYLEVMRLVSVSSTVAHLEIFHQTSFLKNLE